MGYRQYFYEVDKSIVEGIRKCKTEEAEKEKIDEQVQHAENATTWTLIGMGIIIFIGIIITAICGG